MGKYFSLYEEQKDFPLQKWEYSKIPNIHVQIIYALFCTFSVNEDTRQLGSQPSPGLHYKNIALLKELG